MKTRHFAPSFISCSASVHPGMTRFTGKLAGSPRSTELSKTVPSIKRAVIVDFDFVGRPGLFSRSLLEHEILQSAREGLDAFFLGVVGQKLFALLLVGLGPGDTRRHGSSPSFPPDSSAQPGSKAQATRAIPPIAATGHRPRLMTKMPFQNRHAERIPPESVRIKLTSPSTAQSRK